MFKTWRLCSSAAAHRKKDSTAEKIRAIFLAGNGLPPLAPITQRAIRAIENFRFGS
jgi:hypothetical protein